MEAALSSLESCLLPLAALECCPSPLPSMPLFSSPLGGGACSWTLAEGRDLIGHVGGQDSFPMLGTDGDEAGLAYHICHLCPEGRLFFPDLETGLAKTIWGIRGHMERDFCKND